MSTSSAINSSVLLRLSLSILPGRMKRLVFLASLAAYAENTKIPEQDFMRKLNEVLNLSTSSDNAMKFPIHISRVIWSNKKVFQEDIETLVNTTDQQEARDCATRIASAVPKWLTGENQEAVINDIIKLFTGTRSPFVAPTGAA